MRQNGFEAKILQHAGAGKVIFGICGGYQMLGKTITDPDGIECKGAIRGMGLLPTHTVFQTNKTRTRVSGTFGKMEGILKELAGTPLEGYEIHMGTTEIVGNGMHLTEIENDNCASGQDSLSHNPSQIMGHSTRKVDGAQSENVYGSYVHGIFDGPEVAKNFVSILLKEKGYDVAGVQAFQMKEYKEKQYDILADAVRSALEMEKIYDMIDKGMK